MHERHGGPQRHRVDEVTPAAMGGGRSRHSAQQWYQSTVLRRFARPLRRVRFRAHPHSIRCSGRCSSASLPALRPHASRPPLPRTSVAARKTTTARLGRAPSRHTRMRSSLRCGARGARCAGGRAFAPQRVPRWPCMRLGAARHAFGWSLPLRGGRCAPPPRGLRPLAGAKTSNSNDAGTRSACARRVPPPTYVIVPCP